MCDLMMGRQCVPHMCSHHLIIRSVQVGLALQLEVWDLREHRVSMRECVNTSNHVHVQCTCTYT